MIIDANSFYSFFIFGREDYRQYSSLQNKFSLVISILFQKFTFFSNKVSSFGLEVFSGRNPTFDKLTSNFHPIYLYVWYNYNIMLNFFYAKNMTKMKLLNRGCARYKIVVIFGISSVPALMYTRFVENTVTVYQSKPKKRRPR